MLYEVVNSGRSRTWCGPAAVAAITGKDVAYVMAMMRQHRQARGWKAPVKGTYAWELRAALGKLGYHMLQVPVGSKPGPGHAGPPTLARWARERTPEMKARVYIVEVTNHWVVVDGHWFCDSHTRKVVRLSQAPHRRRRVHAIYCISR